MPHAAMPVDVAPAGTGRRRLLTGLAAALAWPDARALLAGAPPDSPEKRIDPNTPASPFSGVVSLVKADGACGGTATLIGRRHAITAGHVAGDPMQTRVCINVDDVPLMIPIRRSFVHPRFAGVNGMEADFDVGVLELASAAPQAARRYALHVGPLAVGQILLLAGYGDSGTGAEGVTVPRSPTVKRRGGARIDALRPAARPVGAAGGSAGGAAKGDAVAGGAAAGGAAAGDGPARDASPGTYLFIHHPPAGAGRLSSPGLPDAIQTGLAAGDSGSPAFVPMGNDLKVMGVNTFIGRYGAEGAPAGGVQAGYGTVNGGAVLARHIKWIWSVMNG